jgi:hypothetical protein
VAPLKRTEIDKLLRELNEHRSRAPLYSYLQRFVNETGKSEEFLAWLAKEMDLDKPIAFNVEALTDEGMPADGQTPRTPWATDCFRPRSL